MEENKKEMNEIEKLRHSAAHLLAQAVKELFPDVKLGIGPVIEDGFYYDFNKKEPFTNEDLIKLESKMKELSKQNLKIEQVELSPKEITELKKKEPFKKELMEELESKKLKPTFYRQGNFVDLCRGPHVNYTAKLKAFKLMKVSGAYWKGDQNREQMQRIYGTCWPTKDELDAYLKRLEEAEKRNHKKIGEEMELFTLFEQVGKGLPIWLPKGQIIKNEVETFAKEVENKAGYVRVSTPNLAKKELFIQSGHLPYYAESMYPPMVMDDGEYYLKAMNCPMHHLIYGKTQRSYRELPLRIAEYGVCYRNELSGTLTGLLRVRMLSMNDAHIYCTKDQIEKEIESVLSMIKHYYEVFNFKDYSFRLSLHSETNKEKYIDEPENWKYAEGVLRRVLEKLNLKFSIAENEAAFYGPKIDVQFRNVYGREETMSTVQLDFAAKKKFSLHYFDASGNKNNEVFVIHRAPLSTHERFMAFLIEHFAGKFPLWLSPVQVKLLTVTDRAVDFAEKIRNMLSDENVRVELDSRTETIPKKVRDAQLEYVPLIVTIGDKEVDNNTLAVRTLDGKVKFGVKPEDFVKLVKGTIKEKAIEIKL